MKRKYVLLVLAALILVGAVAVRSKLPELTVDLPEFQRPTVEVQTESLGLSAP